MTQEFEHIKTPEEIAAEQEAARYKNLNADILERIRIQMLEGRKKAEADAERDRIMREEHESDTGYTRRKR